MLILYWFFGPVVVILLFGLECAQSYGQKCKTCSTVREPLLPVHGQRKRHARHDYKQSENHGASVGRQPRVGQHGRRVRFHDAGAACHLEHGQRQHDD